VNGRPDPNEKNAYDRALERLQEQQRREDEARERNKKKDK
jgi:hypothetical protein